LDLIFENIEEVDGLQMHFIISRGRSGTTLLSSMLNQYDEVLATHENQFMLVFYYKFHKKKKWQKADIDFILNNLWIKKKMMRLLWRIDMDKLRNTLYHFIQELNYGRLCKIIYCSHCNFSYSNNIIIDKNPVYSFHISKWKVLFPNAKFVILIRDYRAQYLSMNNSRLNPFLKNKLQFYWNYTYSLFINDESLTKHNCLFIKYENLVVHTQSTIDSILSFLNIDIQKISTKSSTYISIDQKDSIVENVFFESHQNVNKAIDPSKMNRWQKELPTSIIRNLETFNGYIGNKFGYPLTQIKNPKPFALPFRKKILILLVTKYIFLLPIIIQKLMYNLAREKVNSQIEKKES